MRSFWKYLADLERRETRRYIEMFYILMMRPLIAKVALLPPARLLDAWSSLSVCWMAS